jgi:Spy/CpxP family protein refolding chaperone
MLVKLLIPATLAAGLCTPFALKGGFHGGAGQMPGAFLESKLKLTADQKTAVHEVFKRHKPILAANVEALIQARNAALDSGMDPTITQEAWRAQQERMADAVYDVAKEVRRAYLEALPILTDAQKAEGKALLKKAHGHMEGMHGRHHEFALHFLTNRLDLTKAQVTAIQTVLDNHKTALKAKQEALHKEAVPAMEAAMDPATPQSTMDQRFGTVKEAGFALSAEVRATYLEIVPHLTPEQREAAKGLMQDFRNAVDGVRKLALGF